MSSCDQASTVGTSEAIDVNDLELSYRSSNPHIDWLIDFQAHLKDLRDVITPSQSFTEAEAVRGSEALLNIKHTIEFTGVHRTVVIDSVNRSGKTYYQSFTEVQSMINGLNSLATDESLYIIDLVSKDAGTSTSRWLIKMSVQEYSTCLENRYGLTGVPPQTCDMPFDQTEEYLLWIYGINPEYPLVSVTDLECNNACGNTEVCSTPDGYAIEEVQKYVNRDLPDPVCPPGLNWTGEYQDVTTGYVEVVSWPTYYDIESCFFQDYEYDGIMGCTCLDSDILNCLYCEILTDARNLEGLFGYLSDVHIISIDLGVDVINANTPLKDRLTGLMWRVTTGVPICTVQAWIDPALSESIITWEVKP